MAIIIYTAYICDSWNPIAEIEYSIGTPGVIPAPLRHVRYTWGADVSGSLQGAGGVGGLLMAEEVVSPGGIVNATPISHYHHYDGNGNVIALTDAAGALEGRYRYNAFGGASDTVTSTTFAANQPFRFSTKYLDATSVAQGLYYYGYRYYAPVVGRWLNRDPIGERGGMNLFEMVRNRIISFVDKKGLDIVVTTGNSSSWKYNPLQQFGHQQICVDTWTCCNKPGKTPINMGRRCFSFGASGVACNKPSKKWLGGPTSFNAGGPLEGTVEEVPEQGWVDTKTKKTTCKEDQEFFAKLQAEEGMKDTYSVLHHNCRLYAQSRFASAPGTEPPGEAPEPEPFSMH